MSAFAAIHPVERLIEERFGLACSEWQRQRMAGVLESVGAARGLDLSAQQLRMLVEQLTVGESHFFREPAQLDALLDVVLPERLRAAGPSRPIRILSAGCASGEEVYSLAILIEERAPAWAERVHIHGIDINPIAVEKALRAEYSAWSLRGIPEPERARWFNPVGEAYQLRNDFRVAVTFEERNLLEAGEDFWMTESFDVIFCRNVIIYFSDRAISAVIARFFRALELGAYLFLGHSERLRGISTDFDTLHTHGAFYHRRKSQESRVRQAACPDGREPSWFEDIDQASRRVADLTRLPAAGVCPEPLQPAVARTSESIEEILKLIETERFDEALEHLETMASGARSDPYLDFLTAIIWIGQERLGDAEELCQRLLDTTGFESSGHYLLGLCREHQGCPEHAERRYQEAVRIDPSFAMPWLRLGLLARRAGNSAGARQYLLGALDRFHQERSERIRLLGGGFPREAFLDLCRTQLDSLVE